jgi:hypothetical protein
MSNAIQGNTIYESATVGLYLGEEEACAKFLYLENKCPM